MKYQFTKNIFFIFFNIINFAIFLLAAKNSSDLFSYSWFSIISLISINYCIKYWKFYSELFLNIFIYLGFWFNFSLRILQSYDTPVAETNNYLSKIAIQDNYIEVLNIISISILSITLFFILLKKFFLRQQKEKKTFIFLYFIIKRYKLVFFSCFFTLFSLIIFLNSYYDFAYLGQQTSGFFIIEKLFKYLLMIFFPLTITLTADLYFKVYGKSFILIFIFIICLFSISLTLDSRALLISLFPILLIYSSLINNIKRAITLFVSSISLFLILFILVDQNRTEKKFSISKSYETAKHITYLVANRWVGIAGMINVNYTKNKNYTMFIDSFSEKSQIFNYYERNYFYSQDESQPNFKNKKDFFKRFPEKNKQKRISVFIPGFMAYFYYSGSLILLIFLNFLMVFILISVEKALSIIIGNKKFFLAMFSMIFVWRVVHFGLFPFNSILFFLILILTPIVFYFIDKLLLYVFKRI